MRWILAALIVLTLSASCSSPDINAPKIINIPLKGDFLHASQKSDPGQPDFRP